MWEWAPTSFLSVYDFMLFSMAFGLLMILLCLLPPFLFSFFIFSRLGYVGHCYQLGGQRSKLPTSHS